MTSIFFFKKKKTTLKKLFPSKEIIKDLSIKSVKTLSLAEKNDLTFFDKPSYSHLASSTNAGVCVTTDKLKKYVSKKTQTIIVKNVLYELALVLKKIYISAEIDYPDLSLKKPSLQKNKAVKFGNQLGLEVHAGHGLTFHSAKILSKIKNIQEFNIGHFLIGEAIFIGLSNSIKLFKKILKS